MRTVQRLADRHAATTEIERIRDHTAQPIEQLRTTLSATLLDLAAEAQLVDQLVTTRQPGRVVVTAEMRAAMDAQAAADRGAAAQLRRNPDDVLGHAWLKQGGDAPTQRPTAAPGNVSAISVTHQTTRTLAVVARNLATRIRLDAHTRNLAVIVPAAPGGGEHTGLDVAQLVDHIRNLLPLVAGPRTLAELLEIAEQLILLAAGLIDGNDRTHMANATCPHCGSDSLIVIWRQWVIRCDKSPYAEHYAPCTCTDSLCECKHRPVAHRHTWHLSHGPSRSDSWHSLARKAGLGDASRYIADALADVKSRDKTLSRLTKRHRTQAPAPDTGGVDVTAAIHRLDETQNRLPIGRPASETNRCPRTDLPADTCGCPDCRPDPPTTPEETQP